MTESALVNVNQAREVEKGQLQESQQATQMRGEELRRRKSGSSSSSSGSRSWSTS